MSDYHRAPRHRANSIFSGMKACWHVALLSDTERASETKQCHSIPMELSFPRALLRDPVRDVVHHAYVRALTGSVPLVSNLFKPLFSRMIEVMNNTKYGSRKKHVLRRGKLVILRCLEKKRCFHRMRRRNYCRLFPVGLSSFVF